MWRCTGVSLAFAELHCSLGLFLYILDIFWADVAPLKSELVTVRCRDNFANSGIESLGINFHFFFLHLKIYVKTQLQLLNLINSPW